MSETALILVDRTAMAASFTEQAEALKREALEGAALIRRVSSPSDNQTADAALKRLSEIRKQITKAHEEAKRPYLTACQNLDAKKKAFLDEIIEEERTLGRVIGDYLALEEEKREKARLAAALEAQRIEREAQEAIRRAAREEADRKAELDRQAAEAARMAREATNKIAREESDRRQAEIAMLRQQSEAKSLEEMDRARESAQAQIAAMPEPAMTISKPAGQTAKKDWDVIVNDKHQLARCHPNCVNIEPLMGEIKALLNAGIKVAGVTAKAIVRAGTRSAAQTAIDI
jgi:hypothetical protein